MSVVINIDNISKRYYIPSTATPKPTTLKEAIYRKISKLTGKSSHAAAHNNTEFWALKDINMQINEGDRVALIGKNGSGKSTLLKIISRIIKPTSGSVKTKGRIASLLEVGTGFHPELSGRENVFLNGALLGMTEKEIHAKFDEILAFSEIGQFIESPVKWYSSGMYTRLGFAVAANLNPDILILDEVFAVGDVQFQKKCMEKINSLSQAGKTILFVSHDTATALRLCNRGFLLERGHVIESGSVEKCIAAYTGDVKQDLAYYNWQGNEGDDYIRFYSLSIKRENSSCDWISQGDEIEIEVSYEVLKDASDCVFGINLFNSQRSLLATSTIAHMDEYHRFVSPGRHLAMFKLKTHMLHDGEYIVGVDCLVDNNKKNFNSNIAMKIKIYEKGNPFSYLISSKREGLFLGNSWTLSAQ